MTELYKMLEERPQGSFYIGPLDEGIAEAESDRTVVTDGPDEHGYAVELGELPDSVAAGSVAEWGRSATGDREEAWRYALRAFYGPLEDDA